MKMNKIELNNLDKSTWTTYRFDQIAASISERIDPTNTDLKHYIGLEHIDSENIHIARMGSPDEVSGQKMRCYPGDVIFGRRRAYQRKAAVCEVDGFCSAHSLVLRANYEVIDPELFPFFLHSDTFMHRAVDISVGSLSPTINWKTLKKQEFLLPPVQQQAQLAGLLWAMDDVTENNKTLYNKVIKCEKALSEKIATGEQVLVKDGDNYNFLHNTKNGNVKFDEYSLDQLCSKVSDGEHLSPAFVDKGYPILSAKDILSDEIRLANSKFISKEAFEISRKRCNPDYGDVLIVSRGATIGRTTVNKHHEPFALMGSVILLKPNSMILGEYLELVVKRKQYQHRLLAISGSTAQQAIYLVDIKKSKLKIPSTDYQEIVVGFLKSIRTVSSKALVSLTESQTLQKSLINQVF